MVRLTIVGCSGSFPGPDSPASCYLVEHDGFALLLDLGNGSLGPLQRHIDLRAVHAVVLSHLHADHCLDLTSYYVARRYHPDGPMASIPVHGPAGTAARLARAYDLPEHPGMTGEFDFVDLLPGSFRLGPFAITARRVAHPVEAYAVRVEADGSVLAYSGDTGPDEVLVEIARDAHVALFEASFLDGDNPPNLHMSAREAGALASAAGARELVLTHLVPWNDPARSAEQGAAGFGRGVRLAEPGLVLEF